MVFLINFRSNLVTDIIQREMSSRYHKDILPARPPEKARYFLLPVRTPAA